MKLMILFFKLSLLVALNVFCHDAMSQNSKTERTVLVLLSTHDSGYWAGEVIDNYAELSNSGVKVVYASPEGKTGIPTGMWLLDQKQAQTYQVIANQLSNPVSLSKINPADYDAIFIPGGSAPMYELYDHPKVNKVVAQFYESDKPVSAVCHGPAALAGVKLSDGSLLIKGKKITGVSNAEEDEESIANYPFLLENHLSELGAVYSAKAPGESWVVKDGLLLTGQNPESTIELSKQLTQMINQ